MEIPEPPTLGTEDVDGTPYVLQRRELGFWALHTGELQIPAFSVRVAAPESPGGAPVEYRLATEPLALEVRLPPGAEGVDGLVSTSQLAVREDWQPQPGDHARVGDAFVRTVTRTAPDVPGMVFRPLPLAAVEGLRAYPAPPVVRDHVERGDSAANGSSASPTCASGPAAPPSPRCAFPGGTSRARRSRRPRFLPSRCVSMRTLTAAMRGSLGERWRPSSCASGGAASGRTRRCPARQCARTD
jgi:hypothetical protein